VQPATLPSLESPGIDNVLEIGTTPSCTLGSSSPLVESADWAVKEAKRVWKLIAKPNEEEDWFPKSNTENVLDDDDDD